jgi:alpha-1,2-mannosyltransferase
MHDMAGRAAAAINRMGDILRSGAWLTRERILLLAIAILCASGVGFIYLLVTANGLVDAQGRPLGTDFSSFYAAGAHVLDGNPAAPYDLARQYAREQAIFGASTPFYGWLYPPFFLFIAAVLALMPYGAALATWQTMTLGFYLLVIRAILATSTLRPSTADVPVSARERGLPDHLWFLLALAFPAVLINIGHGQNGFLTAALIGGALSALDRRPIVAGVLFGLLAYKPQFGLMIPIVLAASARWRAFSAAVATVAFLVAAATLVFGWDVWHAFLESTRFTRVVVLEQGDPGWYKMQSVFAWARMWGAPIPLAYALQGAVVAGLVAALIGLWRSAKPYSLKAAAFCLATILATPFTFDYDMMVLAPAIAFFAADGLTRGFGPWEKTALAALWLTPLVARTFAQMMLVPIGVPAMVALLVLLLRRSTSNFTLPMAFSGKFLLK